MKIIVKIKKIADLGSEVRLEECRQGRTKAGSLRWRLLVADDTVRRIAGRHRAGYLDDQCGKEEDTLAL